MMSSSNRCSVAERLTRFCAVVALLVATAAPARAQLAIDKLDLVLRPDASDERTGVLVVRNESDAPTQAVVSLEDWDRAPDGNNRFYPAGTVAGSCAQSLSVFPLSLSLKPGEAQTIRIDYTGPAQRAAECWSLVVVESAVPRPGPGGRQLMYHVRTGLKVYVSPEHAPVDGEVEGLSVARTTVEGRAKDVAIVAFANRGGKHYVARGRLEIRREDNSLVQSLELPPLFALPGATMHATATLPSLPRGRYLLLGIIDYGGSEVAAGMSPFEAK
jgi:P pilus assembly chaperone PapD